MNLNVSPCIIALDFSKYAYVSLVYAIKEEAEMEKEIQMGRERKGMREEKG